MAGSVVIQSSYLALTVVQLDRFVVRNQPLAILPTVSHNINDLHLLRDSLDANSLHNKGNNRTYCQYQLLIQFYQ